MTTTEATAKTTYVYVVTCAVDCEFTEVLGVGATSDAARRRVADPVITRDEERYGRKFTSWTYDRTTRVWSCLLGDITYAVTRTRVTT